MPNSRRTLAGAFLVPLMLLSGGCGSTPPTTVNASWADRSAGPIEFQKVLAVFMSPDDISRRKAEVELVRLITRTEAVASHRVFGKARPTEEEARAEVLHFGFDGAVVMRVIEVGHRLKYEPGMMYPSYYGSFWGYYGYGWGSVYSPGYLRNQSVVQVETNLYSIADDRLLFSAVSETFDASNLESMVEGVVRAAAKELEKRDMLPAR